MIIRCLSFLAGVAILAAAAFATIVHTQADDAQSYLIIASVVGLVVGAIVVSNVQGASRWLLIVGILLGEFAGGWMTFERQVEVREARAAVGRTQAEAIDTAADRLTKAEKALTDAQNAVKSQAALKDCKDRCMILLKAAVDAATNERNDARKDIADLPKPQASDVAAGQTGIPAWKITLAVAIALVLSTNGMGAVLVGVAARPIAPSKPAEANGKVQLDFQPLPLIVVSDDPAPDSPGDSPGRTDKKKALSELLAMLADGRTIPSQEHLADHWNRPKQTVSDWLNEWRRIGVIPSGTRIGRCKATVPA